MYLLFPNDPRFVNISEKRNCNNEQNHHENRRELHPGTGLDTWQEKGLQAEFDKVLSCDMHMAVASVNIKPPKADTPPDNAVVSFRSCTIAEDSSFEDAFAATQKRQELTGGKVSCDVPRVYSAELVRSAS